MIKIKNIASCLVFVFYSFMLLAQPGDIRKQALDDAKTLSAQSYPQIEDFHKALRLQLAGQTDEAKRIYTDLLQKDPNNEALHYALGNIAQKEGNLGLSTSHFEKAHALDPNNLYYTEILALNYLEEAKFKEALPLWLEVVENQPRDFNFQYYLAQCYVQLGQYKEAVETLNTVESLVGVNPQISILKIEMLPLINENDKIEEEILKLRKTDPYSPETQRYVLRYYIKSGKSEAFRTRLKNEFTTDRADASTYIYLLAIHPSISDSLKQEVLLKGMEQKELPAIYIADNLHFLHKQNALTTDSLTAIAKNLEENFADHPEVMNKVKAFYQKSGNVNNVLQLAQKALDENPNDADKWFELILLQQEVGLFFPMNITATEAVENYPVLPQFYYINAQAVAYFNELTVAKELYETAAAYQFTQNDTVSFFQSLAAAHIALLEKNHNVYKTEMKKARDLGIYKKHYASNALYFQYYYQAPTLIDLKTIDVELENLSYFQALNNAAEGNYTQALNLLESFLKVYPDHANAWDLIGDVYFKLNKTSEPKRLGKKRNHCTPTTSSQIKN